jgi:hypothetical protein
MQDNEVEKVTEIMRIDDIYPNSTLTVSASEGQVRAGLVLDRTVLRLNPYKAMVRIPYPLEILLQAVL